MKSDSDRLDRTVALREEGIRRRAELEDPDPEVRRRAGTALAIVMGTAGVLQLTEGLGDRAVPVRLASVRRLGRAGHAAILRPVLGRLLDTDADVRRLAQGLFQKQHPHRLREILEGVQDDPDPAVRMGACQQLAVLGDEASSATLEQLLADGDASVRAAAAEGLSTLLDGHERLERALRAPSPEAREAAIAGLVVRRGRAALEALFQAIWDPSDSVRCAVCRALAEFGAPEARPVLARLIPGGTRDVVDAARAALASLGDTTELQSMVARLLRAEGEELKAAERALDEVGSGAPVAPLLEGLSKAGPGRVAPLYRAIGRVGDDTAVGPLVQRLKGADAPKRALLLDTLGNIGTPLALTALLRGLSDGAEAVRETAMDALVRNGEGSLARAVAASLGGSHGDLAALDDPRGVRAMEAALSSEVATYRETACGFLGGTQDPRYGSRLAECLEDEYAGVRAVACAGIGAVRSAEHFSRLVEMLDDSEDVVRWAAGRTIESLGVGRFVQPLSALATAAEQPSSRARGVDALARCADSEATRVLVQAARDPDSTVRVAACQALSGRDGGPITQALVEALGDPERVVRDVAASALAQADNPAIEALRAALKDENALRRAEAARLLGNQGVGEAAERLLLACADPDPSVQLAAHQALVDLGEFEFAASAEALVRGDPEPIRALADPRALPFVLALLDALPLERAGAPLAALEVLGNLEHISRLLAWRKADGAPAEATLAVIAVARVPLGDVRSWAQAIAIDGDGPPVPRAQLGVCDMLVEALTEGSLPDELLDELRGAMDALAAVRGRLSCSAGALLRVEKLRVGLLKRVTVVRCEGGLESLMVLAEE